MHLLSLFLWWFWDIEFKNAIMFALGPKIAILILKINIFLKLDFNRFHDGYD